MVKQISPLQDLHLFIDFRQAYDSIHRQSMWNIMREFGFPEKLIRVTKACYQSTLCMVRCGARSTDAFTVKSGLKQGCILSPLLFNLVMEHVARTILNRPEGIVFSNTTINCLAYADDVDIMGMSMREIETLTHAFKEGASHVGLEINQDKTKLMEVARAPLLHGNVNLAGMTVEVQESFKYLGSIVLGIAYDVLSIA